MLQPARGIDQQGKTGRMAFGKTIGSKAFNLGKTPGRKVLLITVAPHAMQEKGFKFADIAVLFECSQRAAQAVGLLRGKPRPHDGNLHSLLLKQWHAQCFS